MIHVKIKKQGIVTHEAKLSNQNEVDEWISKNKASESWGKDERWVSEMLLQAQGLNSNDAIESRTVQVDSVDQTEYKFAAEYVIEQSDISAEVADKADSDKDEMAEEFSSAILRKIRKVNRKKLRDQVWNVQKVRDLKANSVLMSLKEDIRDGFFGLALIDLNAADVSEFYSSMEKAEILALLQEAHGAST